MKTTDSVMRESEIELLEKTVEDIMVESSCEPDGERLWVKTSYELADLCRPIISHSLAEARREWVDKATILRKNIHGASVVENGKPLDKGSLYYDGYNQAIDDLLTVDNPEEAK